MNDVIRGDISFEANLLDFIVKSDGNPTYNFAVVVDDHEMGSPTLFEAKTIFRIPQSKS